MNLKQFLDKNRNSDTRYERYNQAKVVKVLASMDEDDFDKLLTNAENIVDELEEVVKELKDAQK